MSSRVSSDRIPDRFLCSQGTFCGGLEGLCLLLRRLTYHCRYFDLVKMFARPVPELSMISNAVLDWIYDNHAFHQTSWDQFSYHLHKDRAVLSINSRQCMPHEKLFRFY